MFADVDNSMTIAQEEIFGPVLAVIPYDTEEDAVRIANDSVYGLAGAVCTTDNDKAMKIASQIRTGTYAVNMYAFDPARRSAATRTPASAARTARRASSSTRRPRACCCRSATHPSSRRPRRVVGRWIAAQVLRRDLSGGTSSLTVARYVRTQQPEADCNSGRGYGRAAFPRWLPDRVDVKRTGLEEIWMSDAMGGTLCN